MSTSGSAEIRRMFLFNGKLIITTFSLLAAANSTSPSGS